MIYDWAFHLASVFLSIAVIFSVIRLSKGPSLSDRVLAIDFFSTILLSAIALYTLRTGNEYYLTVGLILALFVFIGTVVFALFISQQADNSGEKKQ